MTAMDSEITNRTSRINSFHVTDSHWGLSIHCVLALLLLEFVDASELQTCDCAVQLQRGDAGAYMLSSTLSHRRKY